jgi:hypothetical protein
MHNEYLFCFNKLPKSNIANTKHIENDFVIL